MSRRSDENDPKSKSIKIDVSLEEHQYLSDQALQMKLSVRKYVRMKALDKTDHSEMACRKVMQLMPKFYDQVGQVDNIYIRQSLMEIGGAICRCLK